MRKAFLIAALVPSAAIAPPANAAIVVLDFENIGTYPSNSNILILDYYNGGTASNGSSGTNYGVRFGRNAETLCLDTPGVHCSHTSRGGLGDPASAFTGLFFLSGDETF